MIEENTPLLLEDCTIKLAKNINFGDKLINMNGESVTVNSITVNLSKTTLVKTRGISYTVERGGNICVCPRKNLIYKLGELFVVNWWDDKGCNTKCFTDEINAENFAFFIEDKHHVNMNLKVFQKLEDVDRCSYVSPDCGLFLDRRKYFPGLLVGLLVNYGYINKSGDICISNNISENHLKHIKTVIEKFAYVQKVKGKYIIIVKDLKNFTVFKSFITDVNNDIVCHSDILKSNKHNMLAFLHGVSTGNNEMGKCRKYNDYTQYIIKTLCAFLNIKMSLKKGKFKIYFNLKPSNNISIKKSDCKNMVNISLESKDVYLTTDMIPICSD